MVPNEKNSVVIFRVLLRSVLVMLARMQAVTMCDLRVMGGLLVMAGLEMLGRLAVMPGSVLMMFRSLVVMLVNFAVAHDALPVCAPKRVLRQRVTAARRVCPEFPNVISGDLRCLQSRRASR
jgi:hypothetical protein